MRSNKYAKESELKMTDERQKKTTDEYRDNWDAIFKKKEKQPQPNQPQPEDEEND